MKIPSIFVREKSGIFEVRPKEFSSGMLVFVVEQLFVASIKMRAR